MPRVSRTARDWLGTTYGDLIEPCKAALSAAVESGEARYWVGQIERCPDTERLHLQWFVRWTRPKRRPGCQRAAGCGDSHVEIRAGTPEEARDYCTKDATRHEGPFEFGTFDRRGQRTDLEEIRREISQGATDIQIAEAHFADWVRYRGSFDAYRDRLAGVRDMNAEPDVRVYHGVTGSGKSRSAWEEFPGLFSVPVPPGRRSQPWFDGYMGHDVALIDDFSGDEYAITFLLRLLDRYPMSVPIKTSFRNWSPSTIIITSNVHPNEWYPEETDAHRAALMRRIKSVTHFNLPL